jgi:hypothetical protein
VSEGPWAPTPRLHVDDARTTLRWALLIVAPVVAAMLLAAILIRPGWLLVAVVAAGAGILASALAIGLYRGPEVTRR